MGNICYTQYRVEGPTNEIEQLGRKINKDLHGGSHDGSCRWFLYGREMKDIEPSDIQPMNDGWSVLSFEAPGKWSPTYQEWKEYIRKVVRKAIVYYYAEELWCGVCETNDLWHKYFNFDYVTMLRTSALTRRDVVNQFVDGAECRHREEQYNRYFKYWDHREFRGALLEFVPLRRRHMLDLIEKMDDLMLREDWDKNMDTDLRIYIVKRIEEKPVHPCFRCTSKQRLWEETLTQFEEIERLQMLVRRLFAKRHQKR